MKKIMTWALAVVTMLSFAACSSSKKAAKEYYKNPQNNETRHVTEQKVETREVDRLAAAETDRMRAVGIGNDYDEKQARREAMIDARNTLAGYMETAVLNLTQEYSQKSILNKKKMTESTLKGLVETSVSQKLSTKLIGVPEIYRLSDGTIQVYVCLEMTKPTKNVLGDVYDNLSREDALGADYDREKFIQDNLDRIQELRENVK